MESDEKLDIHVFIDAVQARPPLWDPAYGINADPVKSRPLWEEVYRVVFPKYDQFNAEKKRDIDFLMQTKWKNLRAEYVRETKRIMSSSNHQRAEASSKFKLYKPLKFLHCVLTHDEYAECLSNVNMKLHKNLTRRRPSHITDRNSSVTELAYVYFDSIIRADSALRNTPEGSDDIVPDSDRYVWLTFLPFIKKVPEKRRPELMENILNLIQEYSEAQ